MHSRLTNQFRRNWNVDDRAKINVVTSVCIFRTKPEEVKENKFFSTKEKHQWNCDLTFNCSVLRKRCVTIFVVRCYFKYLQLKFLQA